MPRASKAVKSTELTVCSCWSKEVTFVERLIQSETSRKAHIPGKQRYRTTVRAGYQ